MKLEELREHPRMWRFFQLTIGLLVVGTAAVVAGMAGAGRGGGLTWYGWVGVVVLFGGMALAFVLVGWGPSGSRFGIDLRPHMARGRGVVDK